MIKPKKNFIVTGFFSRYITWIIGRRFQKVAYNDCGFDAQQSILLIANHFSWWDGFLLYHLNKIHFKKAFHIMVLEDTMQKVGFMKYLGAFSVSKSPKQLMGSLSYAAELLNQPDNMVVIFPQGKLYSNFVDEVKFEKGLSKIIEQVSNNFQYVFSATFIENFECKKPTVFINLKALNKQDIANFAQLQNAYQQHYQSAKAKQTSTAV